jgi:hypothetical protein
MTLQVLNLETKLYISRQGTARCSQWTQLNSRRITIYIYLDLSTLPFNASDIVLIKIRLKMCGYRSVEC